MKQSWFSRKLLSNLAGQRSKETHGTMLLKKHACMRAVQACMCVCVCVATEIASGS